MRWSHDLPLLKPHGDGVSERRNRTLLDMIQSMMSQADLPPSFWGHAPEIAGFTLNRVPSKAVEKTSYEMMYWCLGDFVGDCALGPIIL